MRVEVTTTYVSLHDLLSIDRATELSVQCISGDGIFVSTDTSPETNEGFFMKPLVVSEAYPYPLFIKSSSNEDGIATVEVITDRPSNVSITNDSPISTLSKDIFGNVALNTVFGELITGRRTDSINLNFQYGLSSKNTKTTTTGAGTYSIQRGAITFSSGNSGSISVRTRKSIRYAPHHQSYFAFTAMFSAPSVGSKQLIGAFTSQDSGIYLGYTDNTLGVTLAKTSLDKTTYPLNSNASTLDPTKYNIFVFEYGWLGIAPIVLRWYSGKEEGWKVIWSYDGTNLDTEPHLTNPSLPIQAVVQGTNVSLKTSSWCAGIVGDNTGYRSSNRTPDWAVENKTISANTVTPILSFRTKTVFNDIESTIYTRLGTFNAAADGNRTCYFYVFRNATLTGANFQDVDTANYVSQYDTSATAVTGGERVGYTIIAKSGEKRLNFFAENDVDIDMLPGDTLSFCAKSAQSSVVDCFVGLIEEF